MKYIFHIQPTLCPADIYLPSMTASCVTDIPEFDIQPDNSNSSLIHTDSPPTDISSEIHDTSPHFSPHADNTTQPSIVPSSFRKSTRIHKPPTYLSSYKCNVVHSTH